MVIAALSPSIKRLYSGCIDAGWRDGLTRVEKTVDTWMQLFYFLPPVIGPERVKDLEPLLVFRFKKTGVRGVLSFGPGI